MIPHQGLPEHIYNQAEHFVEALHMAEAKHSFLEK